MGNDSSKSCVGNGAGGSAVGGGDAPIVFVVASEWLGGVEGFRGRVQDITIDDCLDFSWSNEMVASLQGPVVSRWSIADLARYAAVENNFDAVLVRPIGEAIAMDVEATDCT